MGPWNLTRVHIYDSTKEINLVSNLEHDLSDHGILYWGKDTFPSAYIYYAPQKLANFDSAFPQIQYFPLLFNSFLLSRGNA